MNSRLSYELRIVKGDSLAKFATADNIEQVVNVASGILSPDKIVSQLEQKACKVPVNVLAYTLSNRFDLWSLNVRPNDNGEKVINTTSPIFNKFVSWLILHNGFERTVNSLVGLTSVEATLDYLIAAEYTHLLEECMDYANLPYSHKMPSTVGCDEQKPCRFIDDLNIGNNLAIILRKYLSMKSND